MSSSIGFLFLFITVMYIVIQISLIGVAIYFWKRYPRPSLYLALMASIEILGSLLQSGLQYGLQFMMNWGTRPFNDVMFLNAMTSLVRFAAHILAMCFLVMAVYVARRPNTPSTPPSNDPTPLGTPGMENGDQAFLIDPKNPYTPPRQPR